ncbi:excisionase family DNA-binding protein [Rhodococcus sp. IEGM 1302]|uniref:excisionase family DNA-binding protein n=1 Tax=Rhodococcus sp. IEGM 1302 TaxID=3047093 RepID=UPI0024B67A20|nr:excisionase family DNA-binding protein [Rhodococcus sp. IEGM 1302]MDI9943270.1 excisionase family DNA-binding protein [Rhodococcus sp. IEGM 1302]
MISVVDAAKRLAVHPITIRRMLADGRLTGFRVGGHLLRIDAAEVEALLVPVQVKP